MSRKLDDNELFIATFQRANGLEPDGWAGRDTRNKLTEITGIKFENSHLYWNRVTASDFASMADLRAFERCKAQGNSDQFCFAKGDNGVGAWGHKTAQLNIPMVALPRDDWKAANKTGGDQVYVRYNGKQVLAILGDTMPWKRNIKNGAGIDLNPACLEKLGLKSPSMTAGVEWAWA